MKLFVENEAKLKLGFNFETVARQVAEKVLDLENCPYEAQVSLLLTDSAQIRIMNRQFRNIDSETDVLSFPLVDFEKPSDFASLESMEDVFDPETGELMLGDIVISADKVLEQADDYGHSVKREFAFLVAHSMYHLLGYDHMTDPEEEEMTAKQELALKQLGITRDAADPDRIREHFRDKSRIVVKIGSSSLTHAETGKIDLIKLEILVRELSDLAMRGKEVVLVSSGAIATGRDALQMMDRELNLAMKQACASVGQAKLMMLYQKLFSEYNQICSQVLLTKDIMLDDIARNNARNTFNELLSLGVIPVVNENDTVVTDEIDKLSVFGDNDTLSAVVAALIHADLLILLSDIDGLYTDDPRQNPDAEFIHVVEKMDDHFASMGKRSTGSKVGTGGMATKLSAARIATGAGADMVIANGEDFHVLHRIINGEPYGTVFLENARDEFYLLDYLRKEGQEET